MAFAACTVVVKRLPDGRYRATSPLLPDGDVFAHTEDAARSAMNAAVADYLGERLECGRGTAIVSDSLQDER